MKNPVPVSSASSGRSHSIYNPDMKLVINGEERVVPDVAHLSALIEALEMKADRVAVELNREIVQRVKWVATPVKEGDKLEIVHFVGGGASQ